MAESGLTRAPLEELMLSMDVVDTLRHQQALVDRELNAEARRAQLMERMRDIYAAQGIEVSEQILMEGVRALEEERFSFTAPASSWQTQLADLYVTRGRWGKPVMALATLALIILLGYYFLVARPGALARDSLPSRLDNSFAQVVKVSTERSVTERARRLLTDGRDAMRSGDYERAFEIERELRAVLVELSRSYQVRIVSRPNQLSGVWRVPSNNPNARNYYLIVEAISASGNKLQVDIRNEEDGVVKPVSIWGIRVDEETFEAVAADKRDDGIIQGNLVGEKPRGQLRPSYVIRTARVRRSFTRVTLPIRSRCLGANKPNVEPGAARLSGA